MLLDTSGLLCLLHAAEAQHTEAVSLFEHAPLKVTHNYVLAELVALATVRHLPRQEVVGFVRDLDDSPEVTVFYVDQALHRHALDLLQTRRDKSWSLCDAVSFVLMSNLNLPDALTTDHHFEQAGFRRLLTAIESDWQVGSPVRFYDGDSDVVTDDGAVLASDPPRRLSYSFRPAGMNVGSLDGYSRVTFTIDAFEGLVKLTLVHDELTDEGMAAAFREGWAPILSSLKTFLETGKPLPERQAVLEQAQGRQG
jgi:uncharacterized protein